MKTRLITYFAIAALPFIVVDAPADELNHGAVNA